MTNPNSPSHCRAFQDHEHRFAFARTTPRGNDVFECACGQPILDARDAEQVIVLDENTDFNALPWMLGYDVQDYDVRYWPEEDRPRSAKVNA